MKKKNLIIYVSHLKIREYDWQNKELGVLEKKYNFKMILHEIVEIIHPGFTKIFLRPSLRKKIFYFNDLDKWKKKIIKINRQNKDKVKIMHHMNVANLKSFFILKFLKQQKIDTIALLSPGHPLKNHALDLNFFMYKVKFLFRNPLTIFILIETIIFKFLKIFFNLYPTYALQAGNKHFNFKNKNIRIVKANSNDYSNYLCPQLTRW